MRPRRRRRHTDPLEPIQGYETDPAKRAAAHAGQRRLDAALERRR